LITEDKNEGLVGWQEFTRNRDDILCEYDAAKRRNQSRPVRTSHGNAGEAAIRKWLTAFLPGKFAVTSGFIIPDIVQAHEYKIYDYDVIIYDKDNSPVLWVDGHSDFSEQGRKRAIPARHVKSVIEVKATFTKDNINDAVQKLDQLNELAEHLPKNFTSSLLFFEHAEKFAVKSTILEKLLPERPIVGYRGGVILRSDLNQDMVGLFGLIRVAEEGKQPVNLTDIPLARNIDDLEIERLQDGKIRVSGDAGAGLEAVAWGGQWKFIKHYGPHFWRSTVGINLSWSYSNFSRFAAELIERLEGREVEREKLFYGQIFDKI
jgi:hypothetical protein